MSEKGKSLVRRLEQIFIKCPKHTTIVHQNGEFEYWLGSDIQTNFC